MTSRDRENDIAEVVAMRPRLRTEPIASYWLLVLWGITAVVVLAGVLVISSRLDTLTKALETSADASTLATTRYETLLRSIRDVKVGQDYQTALYNDDVREGRTAPKKERK